MKKEEITSQELIQCICLKTGKFDYSEVTDEDIRNITEIDIRGIKYNGEPTDVLLSELDVFPNLKHLLISHFDLKEDDMEIIARQKDLNIVQFSSCDFENIKKIDLDNLDILVFVGCTDIAKLKMPKTRVLRVIGSELDFDNVDFTNVEMVLIQNSTVRNFSGLESYEKLEEVNFDGSVIYDINGNEVKDIKVQDHVSFSREDKFYPEER